MKRLLIKSNLFPPFSLIYRVKQNQIFVANLPLFATSDFIATVFSNFGSVANIQLRETTQQDKQFLTRGNTRPSRVGTLELDLKGIHALENLKEDEFVILGSVHLLKANKLQFYIDSLEKNSQVGDEWVNLFMKLYDQKELPKEIDGWKINYNYEIKESKRKKKTKHAEFNAEFYKTVNREEDLQHLRSTKKAEDKYLQTQEKDNIFDSV
ncbi:Conserved_hypothetical protein [Hexamita inflata]|uniref:RRM domain-containing protein n=1 Tax=Hexamita inflata TaxID=28002 RepID=A0ABP1H278_9EUKA